MCTRVLVTGGLGFIGSNFIRFILSRNNDVKIINLDKISYGANPANLKDIKDKRYRFIKGDITNLRLMNRLVKDIDAIFNFAAESHVDRSIANPSQFFNSNTKGVLAILESIRGTKDRTRLLQIGTDESYGSIIDGSFKENDLLTPSSPYSASKASADLFCLAYQKTYGIDVVVTRCSNNFGPYQYPEKLIPKTIIRAKRKLKVPVYGSGTNVRDWIYVLDHCEALSTILDKAKSGEVYNIAGGNEYRNIDVIKKILALLGRDENLIEYVNDRPGHDTRYSLDYSKAKRTVNWNPRYNFEDTLKQTVDWYLQNEKWWKPLADKFTLHPTPWKLKW